MAVEGFRENPWLQTRLGHSLNAEESQFQDGAMLGGVSASLNSHSCVVTSHIESGLAYGLQQKGGCASSRPRFEEAL